MDVGTVADIGREALYVLIVMSMPILVISLVVGLIISLLQALTQIQESTLTFVPKIIIVYLSMIVVLPYMYTKLTVFTDHLIQRIIA